MRAPDGSVSIEQVYREDLIEFGGSTPTPTAHLVLDFGVEQDLRPATEPGLAATWEDSDHYVIEMQAIDPETREGLSLPTRRRALIPPEVPEGFSVTNADLYEDPWPDCRVLAVSPRRG